MSEMANKHCTSCESGGDPLKKAAALEFLAETKGWEINGDATAISRTYQFKNYYQTLAFVNAVAWIAHQENHHPTLTVDYNRCQVLYSTHAVKGLSENDFICAAKLNALISTDKE